MKQIKNFFLLIVLMSMIVAKAFAHAAVIGGIYYDFSGSNAIVTYKSTNIVNDNYYLGSVVIPKSVTYNGKTYSVTSIGSSAFEGCSSLKSITIPRSITSIGSDAFHGCSGLTSISIPENVTRIGGAAFSGCSGLTSITIPEGVTSIWSSTFYGCSSLKSITIPRSITSIGSDAFHGCSGLKSVTIPEGVTSIGEAAFYDCSGLTSITIPESVTSIDNHTFYRCSGLTLISIPENVTSIGICTFWGCSGLTSISIPENVTSIGGAAFDGCSGLTSITIPEGVTNIGNYAFSDCSSLTSVTLPNSMTLIGNSAFSGCSGLTSITIPESVTSIGKYAFMDCSGLTSITIPEGVTSIDYQTFCRCRSLTSITIPKGITDIGDFAFYGCSSLTSVTIPEGVTSISDNAFDGCYFSNERFINNSFLSSDNAWGATLVDEETKDGLLIKNNVAIKCRDWAISVTIPESVTTIGNSAFSGCSKLTSVHISDIDAWCNIKFSDVADNPLYIARHLYMNDKEITKLVIPNGTEMIGDYAFVGCEGLTSVVIPNTVKTIGQRAFQDCINLYSVTSLINIPFKLDESTFIYTNQDYDESTIYMITTLYVPRGRDAVYSKVDGWKNFLNIQPTDTKFKLTYLLDDAPYKDYEIQATEVVTPEPDPMPTQEGYIFSGWSEIPWYMPAEDVVVKGSFIVDPDYDSIQDVQSDSSTTPISYYSVDGKLLSKPQQGVNIVRTKGGKTRKLMVK